LLSREIKTIKNKIVLEKYLIYFIEMVENIQIQHNKVYLDGIVYNHSIKCNKIEC
jgi:hypothetical protein